MAYVFNGWLDDAASFAKSLVPSNTIVGKALAGDYKGAAQGTARLVSGATSGATTPRPAPVVYGAQPGLFEPGGFVEKNQTVLLLGAVGLVALFVLMKKKGRR